MPKEKTVNKPPLNCEFCGEPINLSENTIREVKQDSIKIPQMVPEEGAEWPLHELLFSAGRVVRTLCRNTPSKASGGGRVTLRQVASMGEKASRKTAKKQAPAKRGARSSATKAPG